MDYHNKRVLVVGSTEQSGGGVTSVIKLIKKMPVWEKYSCYWLGTQIQGNVFVKLWYACTAYLKALFIIWSYDIIHFHTVPDQSMTVQLPVLLLALVGRKKVIFHIHCGNQLGMDMCTKNRIAHCCMGKADVIVLLAHSFEQLLHDNWPEVKGNNGYEKEDNGLTVDGDKVTVIYNACEGVEAIPYAEHDKTILFAGIFNDNKSADVLIKAVNSLNANGNLNGWKLVLLGSGPQEAMLHNMVKEYGLEDKVVMPGYVYGEKKKEYFQRAGIYAMCSRYEGMPMVVMESWAYGVPVVTTPVGGLPDVMEEGKNCLSFDFGDADGLAKQLLKLITDDGLRNRMSEYSKEFVEKYFSLDTVNKQFVSLYENL